MFCAAGTQWCYAEAVPVGLRYEAVEILRRAHRVRGDPEFWACLQVLEHEALTVLHERAKRRG